MSTLRRAAAITTGLACKAFGRRDVVRAARFVLCRARLDVPNDLGTNGESSLQRWIVGLSSPGQRIRVIDVGANVGRWSAAMLAAVQQAGRCDDLDLHAFEPSTDTHTLLAAALLGQAVHLSRVALGDRTGHSTLHLVAPGAGRNSLYQLPEAPVGAATEQVQVTTLDDYASRAGLEHITLVKIDTEGHDLAVLRGARELLTEQRISFLQFEYNHRWIYGRWFLRDAFELLEPLGYRLGKLTPCGVEFYPGWDVDLETFVEGNYVACASDVGGMLPSVSWWKSGD
jgi:FkbM family methyltransferase